MAEKNNGSDDKAWLDRERLNGLDANMNPLEDDDDDENMTLRAEADLRRDARLARQFGRAREERRAATGAAVEAMQEVQASCAPVKEAVDHPAHYGGANDPFECIKVIEAWDLGFHLGNAVKYISRAGRKGSPLEDLKKARWYLDRVISMIEKQP